MTQRFATFLNNDVTTLLSIFASDILPIFLIAGVGFLLARLLKIGVKTLSQIVFYALVPCFVFRLLVTSQITGAEVGRMALLAFLVIISMGTIARFAAIPLGLTRADLSAFLLVVMFSNGGNYGLPVVLFAFGNEALSHGTVYFVTSSLMTYTLGVFLAATGRRDVRQALGGITKMPAIYGVAAALFVLVTGFSVPVALMRPVGLLSDAALPMMILILGMQLEAATFPKRPAVVAVAVVLSLFVAPVIAYALTLLIGLTGAAQQAGVILASMPVAVITTILAVEFDIAPSFVTNALLVSTLLSPLTLTPIIAFLRN